MQVAGDAVRVARGQAAVRTLAAMARDACRKYHAAEDAAWASHSSARRTQKVAPRGIRSSLKS